MKPRARRARAALRERRRWTRAHLVAAEPNIIISLRRAERLRPVERLMTVRVIELELMRRLFPDGL